MKELRNGQKAFIGDEVMGIDVKWTIKNLEIPLTYLHLFVHVVTKHQRPLLLHMRDPATITHPQRFLVLKRNREIKPN